MSRTLRLQLLDDPHVPVLTNRTALVVEQRGCLGIGKRFWFRRPLLAQQLPAALQIPSPNAVGQEAEVADAHEARWQDVQDKAPNELGRVQGHGALSAALGVVLPAERNPA